MILSKLSQLSAVRSLVYINPRNLLIITRKATHYKNGALKPMPATMPFGIVFVFGTVIPGLFIGAAISKSVANFLEENELFVVSDDDDDDED